MHQENSAFVTEPERRRPVVRDQDIDNLLVAGKCAAGSLWIRPIPSCMAMGQAAGVAAAMASRQGVASRALSTRDLQQALWAQGVRLDV